MDGNALGTREFHRLLPNSSVQFGKSTRKFVVRQGQAVTDSAQSADYFEKHVTSAVQDGSAFGRLKSHGDDAAAALRSAADAVGNQAGGGK